MQMWCRFSSSTVGKSFRNKVYCACLFSATELNTPTEVTPCRIGIARSTSTDFERRYLPLFGLGGKGQYENMNTKMQCVWSFICVTSLCVLLSVALFMCD